MLDWYAREGRHDLPWRKTTNPYRILVSEVMLQQTQVERVVPKYRAFLKRFPNVVSLAKAPLGDVLALWSGLGYNRRALYLKRTGEALVARYKGVFPTDAETLETLPGIGPYTARAVATFSHDASYIFIETNIRRVFIHTFFEDKKNVSDSELIPYIEATLPKHGSPREWYWALMDYGSHLKKTTVNPNKRSAHYVKQSTFRGSVRELRGEFVRICTQKAISKRTLLASYVGADAVRATKALEGLVRDGILDVDTRGYVKIAK